MVVTGDPKVNKICLHALGACVLEGGDRQSKKYVQCRAVTCGKIKQAKGNRGWVSGADVLGSREGREGRSEVTLSGEPDRGREGTLVRDSSRRAVKAKERPVWKLRVGGHLAYLRKRAAWVPRRCSSGRVVTPDNKPEAQPCWPVWRVLSRKGDVSVYLGCETLNLLITYLCTLHQSIHPFLVHCSVSPFSSAWRADCFLHSLVALSVTFLQQCCAFNVCFSKILFTGNLSLYYSLLMIFLDSRSLTVFPNGFNFLRFLVKMLLAPDWDCILCKLIWGVLTFVFGFPIKGQVCIMQKFKNRIIPVFYFILLWLIRGGAILK